MGAAEDFDPFAEEKAAEAGPYPLPALKDLEECLVLIAHWRGRAEAAEATLAHRKRMAWRKRG